MVEVEDNGGENDPVRPDGFAEPTCDKGEDEPITPTEPEDSPGDDEEWSSFYVLSKCSTWFTQNNISNKKIYI